MERVVRVGERRRMVLCGRLPELEPGNYDENGAVGIHDQELIWSNRRLSGVGTRVDGVEVRDEPVGTSRRGWRGEWVR